MLAGEALDDDRGQLAVIARHVAEHRTLEREPVQDMFDPTAAVGAAHGKRGALDTLLSGIGGRDLAIVDLVIEIVVRPDCAGIHVAERVADLFVARDVLPDRQCRMGSVDAAL